MTIGKTHSIPPRALCSVWRSAIAFADNSFRFELEYFYRDTGHDQTSDIPGAHWEASGDKLAQELQVADRPHRQPYLAQLVCQPVFRF